MEQPDDPMRTPPQNPTFEPPPEPAQLTDEAPAADVPSTPVAPDPPDDLATVRDLILLAYQDIVPELVQGGTIAELQAAVAPARAAYRQIAERIASGPAAAPPSVPAGSASVVLPIDGLPPGELIKRALQRRG